jgi:hypothetical protein
MDVLVVVGDGAPPSRLVAKARHIERTPGGASSEALLGDLRARIPRRVGVWGPVGDAAWPVRSARLVRGRVTM